MKTLLLICDVWSNHWCADLRRRTEFLAKRIDGFAGVVRRYGGRVLHCPSETVDSYYGSWPQREAMKNYPKADITVSQEMRRVSTPLGTRSTAGCPDVPPCRRHVQFAKQHANIKILPEDLISDSGQEIYNLLVHEDIGCVFISGLALNMCVLGRPFGVISLVELGVTVRVVSDLVEVLYSPSDFPRVTIDQGKWFTLGYIEAKWCPITTCRKERQIMKRRTRSRCRSGIPGNLLTRLRRQYRPNSFVETGTGWGGTIELIATIFDQAWSCDTNGELVQKAQNRLVDYPNVEFSIEASPDFLRRIKPELVHPVMYWLDAHWCGVPSKPIREKECPLLEEIEAIGSFDGHSVLLIDDINLIESPPPPPHDPAQWPTMPELRAALDAWREPYCLEWCEGISGGSIVKNKILVVSPKG